MNDFSERLARANRLQVLMQQVGFALWQLQELEGVAAQYYVLVALAKRGMGTAEGNVLLEDAQSKTFGATISKLVKENHLPGNIEPRFQALLKERNWLVHSSRSTNRDAIRNGIAYSKLLKRLEAIAEEAGVLVKAVGEESNKRARNLCLSAERQRFLAAEILKGWHGGNAA